MRFVVTLPGYAKPLDFAIGAARAGAHYLEIRDDLAGGLSGFHVPDCALPLLVARRKKQFLTGAWIEAAALVDQEVALPRQSLEIPEERVILSHHAESPMDLDEAVALWQSLGVGKRAVKHVEPMAQDCDSRLIWLQDRLLQIAERVNVLAAGAGAALLRRRLAARNHLHY